MISGGGRGGPGGRGGRGGPARGGRGGRGGARGGAGGMKGGAKVVIVRFENPRDAKLCLFPKVTLN